jgi:uncharacterized protein (TIGR02145 family)
MLACPTGWHLPSNAEWDVLFRFVDGSTSTESPYCSSTAGKLLKAKSGWINYEEKPANGTDAFGFTALPCGGGSVQENLPFDAGKRGAWWTASEASNNFAYNRVMDGSDEACGEFETCSECPGEDECVCEAGIGKYTMLSVRCVKD